MLTKLCTLIAKTTPSRFFGEKAGTQTPFIAGPLWLIQWFPAR
jgi:hypothetical protein